MEETFSEKMIGRFGICGLILIGVTAWLVFALILYGILSVTGVIVTEAKEPEQTIVESYHNTDYDTYMTTGIEIPHIQGRTFDICTVSADDLVNDWTGNDISSLVQAAMSFRITKNDAKWKQGGMTVVPEGATVVDIGLVRVYAWHERTVGTKNQSSDHFVFRVAGDVYHLIRSTKGTTTNVKLTCGRTA